MLELKNIRKDYASGNEIVHALKGVSIQFRKSEFVAILGQSGCGKTTLLNIVGGLDRYTSGDLVIDGISTSRFRARDWDTYRNHRVGFVFQSYNLIPHQSVLSNVELALTLSGVSKIERRRRAAEALKAVGLGDQLRKKPHQMSGGQMQRVAIARALVNDPDIILADEPTGALDTATSVQVMDILQQVAKDRLVVMVTHNPELAEEYATRIIRLRDGVVQEDTNPPTSMELQGVSRADKTVVRGAALSGVIANVAAEASASANVASAEEGAVNTHTSKSRSTRKTRMGFFTALGLSFNNLMTKKGRTLLTAFAGSIGIIGIASILALANGVNNYIASVEEETLSEYPLQIQNSSVDMSSLLAESATMAPGGNSGEAETGDIGVSTMLTSMFSSIGSNDLTALKSYLDSGESGIEQYTNALEYRYDVTPQIYRQSATLSHETIAEQTVNTADSVSTSNEGQNNTTEADMSNSNHSQKNYRQVNPDQTFSNVGLAGSSSASQGMSMSLSMGTTSFYQLPADAGLYQGQYDVKAGRWPENYNECVVVLSSSGKIGDLMQYVLGLRDSSELDHMVEQLMHEEEVVVPEVDASYHYDDILGIRFKLVNAVDYYEYDETYQVWHDKTDDANYMNNLIDQSEDLKIVGIVQPNPDSAVTMLNSSAIYYPSELTEHVISQAASSKIVQDQINKPDINVFTGKAFGDDDSSGFEMNSLFTVDGQALSAAFTIDQSALTANMGSLDLDLSNVTINPSQLPPFDSSALQIDPSQIDLSGLSFDLSGLNLDLSGVTSSLDSAALARAVSSVMQDFWPWYTDQVGAGNYGNGDYQAALDDYLAQAQVQEQLTTAIAGGLNLSGLETSIADQVQAQLGGAVIQQLIPQISVALVQALQMQMQGAIQSYLNETITSVMTQFAGALQQQVGSTLQRSMQQLAANMASAMKVDESVFANALSMNMDGNELTELMVAMMGSGEASYDSNLANLGYADLNTPSEISIYPKDFESKEHVLTILNNYNQRMEDSGEEDKVITYTDLVGTLMSSVTTIVDMISYVLIAFVAIALVVSSIMIGVITYISVLERNKEIGILRAIGASKGDIARVFNAETLSVGFVAGLLGIGITLLVCVPVNAIVSTLFDVQNIAQLPWLAAVILVGISMFLTFVAGLLPSSIASRKDPVVALRSE